MHDYRKLVAWQSSYDLVVSVYAATAGFPRSELYGLTSQVRRSAVSIPSNIAEGAGRGSDRELRRFSLIARGSLNELHFQLRLAGDLGYLTPDTVSSLLAQADRVGRVITGLVGRLSR